MTRNRYLLAIAAAAAALAPFAAGAEQAGRPVGVVELFTSQGCNSCPPADEFLAELAREGDVVALAYHVDYWDYLGWRDTLADPENTARQRDYGAALKQRSVYTPQAVINGRVHANGADRTAVKSAIGQLDATGRGLRVALQVSRRGGGVVIDAAGIDGRRDAHLLLACYQAPQKVKIARGENAGRWIEYWNAVTSIQVAGMWHGDPAQFELPASEVKKNGPGGCAVLLQEMDAKGRPGAILGATVIPVPRS
jgi:hypothetical protein